MNKNDRQIIMTEAELDAVRLAYRQLIDRTALTEEQEPKVIDKLKNFILKVHDTQTIGEAVPDKLVHISHMEEMWLNEVSEYLQSVNLGCGDKQARALKGKVDLINHKIRKSPMVKQGVFSRGGETKYLIEFSQVLGFPINDCEIKDNVVTDKEISSLENPYE